MYIHVYVHVQCQLVYGLHKAQIMNLLTIQFQVSSCGYTVHTVPLPLPTVGHCHPRVTEAGAEQMAKLADVHDPQITEKYTQHLLSTFPDNMGHVFYVHSG